MTYQVIVGNIGTVYSGSSATDANKHFKEYKEQSKNNYGRAAGESVTMMLDGEPVKEYTGRLEREQAKKDEEQ